MLKVAVYGQLKWSHLMKECLENEYSKLLEETNGETVSVPYFISFENENENVISFDKVKELYSSGEINAIVIPKEYYIQYNDIIQQLVKREINVNDIYNGMRLIERIHELLSNDKSLIAGLITPMLSDSYLSYLEYHVADHCNLNCKYCTHYSPLVKDAKFTNYYDFEQDLNRLKNYIDDIGVIRILGGEPLLNPELPRFIELTRQLYPMSVITVVSNGMVIDRISDELVDTMNRNMAFFHISYYPPLEDRMDSIKRFLVEKKIPFTASPKMDKFLKTQKLTASDNTDFFYNCFQATCTCIYEGKIAPCFAPFTTKYFNDAFDKELPEGEGIDLYDEENTTESVKLKLLFPLERCRYCYAGTPYKWEIIGKNSCIEDWADE